MRTLWIAGLGAVLISGGVAAQGMTSPQGAAVDRHGAAMPRVTDSPFQRQPGESPDNTLRGQDPRLNQGRLPTGQNMTQPAPVPPGLQASPGQPTPDRTLDQQDPRLQQRQLGTSRQNVMGGSGPGTQADAMPRRPAGGTAGTHGRTDAPRNPADRAYMGGGMILENGRPVPLPGDPPGMASDFRADGVPQSTATGRTGAAGMGDMAPDGHRSPQTNVGQTGVNDQGMVGTPQGAFPANPGTPGGRVPTGN